MKNHLGIDHPLVAVRDMDKVAADYERLGFFINPRHHHPWGTDNHLLMFADSFIELISVYDSSLLDMSNDQGFAFGRFIDNSIRRREGIAMVALHSEDARADHALMEQRQVENDGIVDFRRIAHRPDGSEEEAVVSLVMLINQTQPPMSHFLCHQHKPHLVWVKEWMQHPNGADGITCVTYVAEEPESLWLRFVGMYGEQAVSRHAWGLNIATDRGHFEVIAPSFVHQRFAGIDLSLQTSDLPTGVAIRVSSKDIPGARELLNANQVMHVLTDEGGLRIGPQYAGNTIIEIYPTAKV
ncbi:MAG: VOC family protein [Gammaproteobacteria bacterium]|nr:VOC family protein [Gammaproteobacteria bacterium]